MPVRLAYSANRVAMPFRRRACRGDYLRKVNIVVSWDWLAGRGIAAETILGAADFVQGGWLAQPEDVARAERLVTLGTQNPVAACPADILEREALSLALLTRLLGRFAPAPAIAPYLRAISSGLTGWRALHCVKGRFRMLRQSQPLAG